MTRSKKETQRLLAAIRVAAAGAVGCGEITECLNSKEADALAMLKDRLEEHRGWTLKELRVEERVLERVLESTGYNDVDRAEDLDSVRMAIEVKDVCRLATAIDALDSELDRLKESKQPAQS